jgi:uncharacterized protein
MIERNEYIKEILKYLDTPVIKVITGMRRCGKSTLMLLLKEHLIRNNVKESDIVYVNKESLEFDSISDYSALNKYVKSKLKSRSKKKYILIDEVQDIGKWEKAVSSFLADKVGDIIITGSNSYMFSSELSTLLSGRYIEIPVFPLSFKEFLRFRNITDEYKYDMEFENYLKFGGLPGIHSLRFEDDIIFRYLNSILDTVLLKDVVSRNKIREISLLENIVKYLMDNVGNVTTSKSITNYFKSQKVKVSVDTVQNYTHFLERAYLFSRVNRYAIKGKRLLEFYDKLFMGDIGLRNGLIGYKDKDISGILENIVLLELHHRGYKVYVGDMQGNEIDFIAEKTNEKIYIQVCYLLKEEKTILREFGNLEKINDNYRKIVLSLDKHFPKDRSGIERINLIDFLLK